MPSFRYLNVLKSLSHFVYPPLCLHCQNALPQRIPLLCPSCLEQITLLSAQERCPTCFSLLQKGRCDQCIYRPVIIRRQIAASECMGPAATLWHYLLKGDLVTAKPLAALMAYQWLEYKMPLPDFIIPLPAFRLQSFNPSLFLAKEISKTFSVPLLPILQKKWDGNFFFTQGEFQSRFSVRKKGSQRLCDQKLLLVADQLDDKLLRRAAQALQPFFPLQIYGLAAISTH